MCNRQLSFVLVLLWDDSFVYYYSSWVEYWVSFHCLFLYRVIAKLILVPLIIIMCRVCRLGDLTRSPESSVSFCLNQVMQTGHPDIDLLAFLCLFPFKFASCQDSPAPLFRVIVVLFWVHVIEGQVLEWVHFSGGQVLVPATSVILSQFWRSIILFYLRLPLFVMIQLSTSKLVN